MYESTRQKLTAARLALGRDPRDPKDNAIRAALDALESELSICEGVTRKNGLSAVLVAIKTMIEPHAADLGFTGDFLVFDGVAALVEAYAKLKAWATEVPTDAPAEAPSISMDTDLAEILNWVNERLAYPKHTAEGYATLIRQRDKLQALIDATDPDRFRGRPIDPEIIQVAEILESLSRAELKQGYEGTAEKRQRQAAKVRAIIEAVYKDGPGITEWSLRQALNLTAEDEAKLTPDYWTALQAVIDHGLDRETADVPPYVDEAADRYMAVVIGGPVNRDKIEALLTKVWGYNHASDFQAAIYTLIEAVRMNTEGL